MLFDIKLDITSGMTFEMTFKIILNMTSDMSFGNTI